MKHAEKPRATGTSPHANALELKVTTPVLAGRQAERGSRTQVGQDQGTG